MIILYICCHQLKHEKLQLKLHIKKQKKNKTKGRGSVKVGDVTRAKYRARNKMNQTKTGIIFSSLYIFYMSPTLFVHRLLII